MLPFECLAWENFERLCLRLAIGRGEVVHSADHGGDVAADGRRSAREARDARLYGVRGQDQQGIDLYVRLADVPDASPERRYLCLQSRRIAKLTAAKLKKAVSDFLKGKWPPSCRVFVYATSLAAVRSELADEIRVQTERLRGEGIEFEVWDAGLMSPWLKDKPSLVCDFFGPIWAESFCGPENAKQAHEAWVKGLHPGSARQLPLRTAKDWGPAALGVHEAIGGSRLPAYIRREHDDLLDAVLDPDEIASRIVVLRGGSSTGKSRSAYQAVTEGPLASWRLERPVTPAGLITLLDSGIEPRTVLWLQELRHFADADQAPEAVARLDRFLAQGQQVVVLTAIWPDHWSFYTRDAPREPGTRDPYVAMRALLARLPELTSPDRVSPSLGGVIAVPASFTGAELAQARLLADPALAEAIAASELAGDPGRLAQYLAGAPDLLRHWQDAGADPYGRALITAAMDYARLADTLDCPPHFLREAVTGYLADGLRTSTAGDWIDAAFRYASAPLRGTVSCLRPFPPEHGTGIVGYELADYLDQHSRLARATAALPASFWEAAARLPVGIQASLAEAAQARGFLRPAAQLLKNTLATGGYAAVDLFKLMSDVDPEREHYGDWIARRAPLDDPDCVGLLLGAFLNAGARNAAQTLIGRNPAANADLSDDPDIGILLDELSRTDADEQIEILLSRADAREAGQPAEPGSNSELDLNELDDEEEVDRTDPADVAFWLQIRIDEGIPDPVTGLIGPDLPPYLLLGYPESVLELLRTLERAGARRHVRTLAKRTAAIADLLANPELSGRVLSILLDVGASEQVTQLMRHGPAGLAELADPRGIACLLDSLRKAGADEQVAALLARDPAKHAVLGHGGGASLVMALYRVGADAQAESLIALLPDAGEFTEFCEFQYGDGPDHAHQYGRKLDGSPESPWGWADLS